MQIAIIGAGTVGYAVARILSSQHSVLVVEEDEKRYEHVINTLNVGAMNANGASPKVLQRVMKEKIDLFLAVTERDETNVFACLVAKQIRPEAITVARMRDHDYTQGSKVSEFLGVDDIISPEYLIAAKMKKLAMLRNAVDHESMPSLGLEIARFRVPGNGRTAIPITGLSLPRDCRILSIRRGGEILLPEEYENLVCGDEVVVIGDEAGIVQFDRVLGVGKRAQDILIVGGSIIADYLLCMLENEKVSVRLIEKNEARCRELARKFDGVVIINDNGTDPLVLRNENVGNTDVLVCTTNNEEGNLLACLVGKHLGVSKTVTMYSKQEYRDIFQMAGIDAAVGYYGVVANEIVKKTVPDFEVVLLMNGAKEELISLKVGSRNRLRDVRLGDAKLPDRTSIAAVISDGTVIIPDPDTHIMDGDTLLIYADRSDISVLERMFHVNIPVSP
ncbi:Trk system potassium transporter TrkA [Methanomassiliicoccus luminyensis]|uniref:Trk system potassium transporter TrkA n=1 Tax=Methanomassiliicoccus luminyensis TaxID=1080712 RepID=UPI0003688181|nr:Trk system potassium transporter TrkA [Methanomassiliicoccus luminyensis]